MERCRCADLLGSTPPVRPLFSDFRLHNSQLVTFAQDLQDLEILVSFYVDDFVHSVGRIMRTRPSLGATSWNRERICTSFTILMLHALKIHYAANMELEKITLLMIGFLNTILKSYLSIYVSNLALFRN